MEHEFQARWPKWFWGLDQPCTESCLAFGFEVGEGWRDLLWTLCEDIERLDPPEEFRVEQVKEKFGGLRFYTSAANDAIWERIAQAEAKSFAICELCGAESGVTTQGRWLKTLCANCREGRQ